ncbi:hypothetical protein HHK36_003595 [Tetracentron sinense]|uniref:COI1 F-box domain-containing protein n=1 Tax=Tetracentron sinense TaxID=13715 RepID=A0A834ZPK3_TETSI|nr:hypothetical protein HHK36_003595 [Tetracentron sinense]
MAGTDSKTHIHDLPEVILSNVFALVTNTRTRNAMSLVCHKWLSLERLTRASLALRGNVRDLFLIPTCFRSVTDLDLSLLSPWGHSFLDSSRHHLLVAERLRQAFPAVISLTVYARTPSTLQYLAPKWPELRRVKLVRWHQRSQLPPESDFVSLFERCTCLTSLDLSHFYYWTEDLPPALEAHPAVAASLSRLDLLTLSSPEGFKSHELLAITASCPNLKELLAACMFDPRFIDFVGDEALLALANDCPRLSLLHLADASSLANARADPDDEGFTTEDARISRATFEELFTGLPLLEELVLDVCHNVRDTGAALELLNSKCPLLKSLKLGQFHGICRGVESQIDGIAVCKGLVALSIKNSADFSDSGLMTVSRGCPRLAKFEIQGCKRITESGLRIFACLLHKTLVDVKISCCKQLNAVCSLRAMEPIRERIQRLHIDCIWDSIEQSEIPGQPAHKFDLNELEEIPEQAVHNFDLNEFEEPNMSSDKSAEFGKFLTAKGLTFCDESSKKKKCRYSSDAECSSGIGSTSNGFSCRTWERLQYLSLWIAVGELLTPLALAGLESCPVLEEIQIRVEGDCRSRPKPSERAFGLSSLARYPQLLKMKLDCSDVIGYALTAPSGQMDLSLWERFYLNGIGNLCLNELDYWPPQDRDVNQRSLSLPAAGLLAECATLRKLFIHGTANEHFMMFLPRIPNLRDVQLREDYYPAPDNDMSTEMRVDSCSRFEDALNGRQIAD